MSLRLNCKSISVDADGSIFMLFLLLVIISSCSEDFFSTTKDFDVEESNQISVVGRLVNTDVEGFSDTESRNNLGFLLARSRTVTESSSFDMIENATINLRGEDGTDRLYVFDERSAYYTTPRVINGKIQYWSVEENTKYDIEVSIPGEDLITATTSTGEFGEIKNVSIDFEEINIDEDITLDKFKITIDDPLGNNYYNLRVFYKFEVDEDSEKPFATTQLQGYILNFNNLLNDKASLFTDEEFDGKTETLTFWSERSVFCTDEFVNARPERVFINLWSLSEEEFLYRTAVDRNEEALNNPFAEPTVVFSNIQNGRGIFSVSNIQSYQLTF